LEEVRYNVPNLEVAFLSLDGARNLDGCGLSVLRSLYLFRENEARRQHRPPFFIIPDPSLVYLAANPTAALQDVPGLGLLGSQRYGRGIRQALHDGLAAPAFNRPPTVMFERMIPDQEQRLTRLKGWRASLATSLSLDPSLLWPTPSLERLARSPDTFEAELISPNIRRWQCEQFVASLRACLDSPR
jgi:ribonuclease D